MTFAPVEAGLVAAAVVTVAVVSSVADLTLADTVFLAVLLSAALLLGSLLLRSSSRLGRLLRHEQEVTAQLPQEVARRAVEAERARISAEIDRSVRRSLHHVGTLARGACSAEDGRPALRQIQDESRLVMQELRRQLGLISRPPDPAPQDVVRDAARSATPDRADLSLVLLVVLLATADQWVDGPLRPANWVMSVAMAATLLWRRTTPILASLLGALVLVLGMALGVGVPDGFFYPVVCGLLLWGVLSLRPRAATLTTAAALLAAALVSRWAHDPENGPINVVVLTLVSLAAVLAGRLRRARDSSADRTGAHEQRLETASRLAVEEDRRALARELHDVASHAVSLVAMQAGAAELGWEQDPEAARARARAITDTVAEALDELSGHALGAPDTHRLEDALLPVHRLRAAGLEVRLETDGTPPAHLLPTVHRILQESLTNVLKHAPGARAEVRVLVGDAATTVEVVNQPRPDGRAAPPRGRGYGLVGLADRVDALGGTLQAGPTAAGGFRLLADLPRTPPRPVGVPEAARRHTGKEVVP